MPGNMEIPFILQTSGKVKLKKATMNMIVDSESRKIEVKEWEDKMGLESPFDIEEFKVVLESLNGERKSTSLLFDGKESIEFEGISFRKRVYNIVFADKQIYYKNASADNG